MGDTLPSVVVVGGGTGTHTVLRGLVPYTDRVRLSAIVSMADSGGSTGRLRDEFGYLPVGDVRNALSALAFTDDAHGLLLRELFLYRFNKGEGLSGHNFGNLLLTALTDMLGSEAEAIAAAARLLRVAGAVYPVTTDNVQLVATYDDGVTVVGESLIDEPAYERADRRITTLSLTPPARIAEGAQTALAEADMIVFGPGDLYTSVIPNILVEGFEVALAASAARIVYVSNLMSRRGQTHGMTVGDHVDELVRYCGKVPDVVFVNSTPLPPELVERYAVEGDHPIVTEENQKYSYRHVPLLAPEEVATVAGDVVRRSFARHHPTLLAEALMSFLENGH